MLILERQSWANYICDELSSIVTDELTIAGKS